MNHGIRSFPFHTYRSITAPERRYEFPPNSPPKTQNPKCLGALVTRDFCARPTCWKIALGCSVKCPFSATAIAVTNVIIAVVAIFVWSVSLHYLIRQAGSNNYMCSPPILSTSYFWRKKKKFGQIIRRHSPTWPISTDDSILEWRDEGNQLHIYPNGQWLPCI